MYASMVILRLLFRFYPGDSTFCHPKRLGVAKDFNRLKEVRRQYFQPAATAERHFRREQNALDRRPGTV
jgi:hypothetical protein